MSRNVVGATSDQLMLLLPDSPAPMSAWPENERDWRDLAQVLSGSACVSWERLGRIGSFLKMSRDYFLPMKEETLPPSFEGWGNSGSFNPSLGLFWTANFS